MNWPDKEINDSLYRMPQSCYFGAYVGSGTVGKSNVRVILQWAEEEEHETLTVYHSRWAAPWFPDDDSFDEPPMVVNVVGHHGFSAIYLLVCDETKDMFQALEDYPILDEDDHSIIELEEEQESWDSWIRADLERLVEEEYTEDQLYEAYRKAMEETNTYPVHETGGCYVDIEAIKDAFIEAIQED